MKMPKIDSEAYNPFDDIGLIRARITQVFKIGVNHPEYEDLIQEGLICLSRIKPKFDNKRPWFSYAAFCLDNAMCAYMHKQNKNGFTYIGNNPIPRTFSLSPTFNKKTCSLQESISYEDISKIIKDRIKKFIPKCYQDLFNGIIFEEKTFKEAGKYLDISRQHSKIIYDQYLHRIINCKELQDSI